MGFYTNFAERLDKRIEIEHGNIGDYEKYRVSDYGFDTRAGMTGKCMGGGSISY